MAACRPGGFVKAQYTCFFCRPQHARVRIQHHQLRTASTGKSSPNTKSSEKSSGDKAPKRPNPVLEKLRETNPELLKQQPAQKTQAAGTAGDLAPSSVFEDQDASPQSQQDKEVVQAQGYNPRLREIVLDPHPEKRKRWERKKIIQMMRKGGRLSDKQYIKQTEREHLVRSHNMKTSVKKLGMLARQIAGKSMDDAITQMRFSKKKVAVEVMKQLQAVRDEAIVMRGMGLPKSESTEAKEDHVDDDSELAAQDKKGTQPIDIQLKDGKRWTVWNRNTMYIDQAWVGRGPYGKQMEARAKGRGNLMRTPWTSISVKVKEEVTRVREYEEREAKRRRKRLQSPWVPLPDHKIEMPRQFYSW